MHKDVELAENGVLIVTGSTLRAERADRPLAYRLQKHIRQINDEFGRETYPLVISDLWYLNGEKLRELPMIAIGGPSVNAVAAHLNSRIAPTLVVDNALTIQLDPNFEDLRACVWGVNHSFTADALNIFIDRGYLRQFVDAACARNLQ